MPRRVLARSGDGAQDDPPGDLRGVQTAGDAPMAHDGAVVHRLDEPPPVASVWVIPVDEDRVVGHAVDATQRVPRRADSSPPIG